ncbi:hypothetical protein [Flavobacterium chungnamense]|uniref:Uncharacterized protein n=1 Tax=Flavobacterium chungnamense TaxID=706182 RepID=A0ABP7UJJ1_9FLAO
MREFIKGLFRKNSNQKMIFVAENIQVEKSRREILSEKFFRNLGLVEDFKLTYECYCDISETWNSQAFADSNITNRQYYETLKQISEEEYSEKQCNAIRTAEIHENAVEDYIISLDSQYDNLKLLCDEIKAKEDKLLGTLTNLKK